MANPPVISDLERVMNEVEESLTLIVGRVRMVLKESATSIHPDLAPVGYKVLASIVRLGETNAYTLAELLETDKSVVSRQVRMLEETELVVSHADAKDGRARVLTATPMARERVQAVKAKQQSRLRDQLRTRSESEVRAFADMLRLLSEA